MTDCDQAVSAALAWQWTSVGPNPVNYGLDGETFDSETAPHLQTFVREAVQNSLDAREDESQPVKVRFTFHAKKLEAERHLFGDLLEKKRVCDLDWPDEWNDDEMSWLCVEDSNTSGLLGDLKSRSSDFWNYWLNFGLSNKDGSGRGGRGIGRVTFLLASRINTVVGITRRLEGDVAVCGMSLMKPIEIGEDFKSNYSYFARGESGNIFDLYEKKEIIYIVNHFEIQDYIENITPGFSLIIPYPHRTIDPDGLIAAAIEHFGPAILNENLVVEVDGRVLNKESIFELAANVSSHFGDDAFKHESSRVLDLMKRSLGSSDVDLSIEKPSARLMGNVSEELRAQLRQQFIETGKLLVAINLDVRRNGTSSVSTLHAAIEDSKSASRPYDGFFREGMLLPKVSAKNLADVDLFVRSDEGELATYLNFCEGKAHLDLLENPEVRSKLRAEGFEDGVALKRFVKSLMEDLRALVLPDADEPDAALFSGFFSTPGDEASRTKRQRRKKVVEIVDPPLPRIQVFKVDELSDGFAVSANSEFQDWPVHMRAEVSYADGSRSPKWNKYDFSLKDLEITTNDCVEPRLQRNQIYCRDCGPNFRIEVRGFDSRRELVTNVRPTRDA